MSAINNIEEAIRLAEFGNNENSFYDVFEVSTYEDIIDYKLKAGIPITGTESDF